MHAGRVQGHARAFNNQETKMKQTMIMTRRVALAALSAAALLSAGPLQAQDFPSRTLTLLVSFTAGGATDVLARTVAEALSKDMKQVVVRSEAHTSELQLLMRIPHSDSCLKIKNKITSCCM